MVADTDHGHRAIRGRDPFVNKPRHPGLGRGALLAGSAEVQNTRPGGRRANRRRTARDCDKNLYHRKFPVQRIA